MFSVGPKYISRVVLPLRYCHLLFVDMTFTSETGVHHVTSFHNDGMARTAYPVAREIKSIWRRVNCVPALICAVLIIDVALDYLVSSK